MQACFSSCNTVHSGRKLNSKKNSQNLCDFYSRQILVIWEVLKIFWLVKCHAMKRKDYNILVRRSGAKDYNKWYEKEPSKKCNILGIKATGSQKEAWTRFWGSRQQEPELGRKMHTLANKISARERETAPKYYYKVFWHIRSNCIKFLSQMPFELLL